MNLNNINLNQIHIFTSVVKHRGYKKASEELHLSRSAISQRIASLEGFLNVKLFHRIGKKLQPTEQALRFYEIASQMEFKLQEGLSSLTDSNHQCAGVLSIGAYLEFAKGKLMPVTQEFLRRYPQATLKFSFESPTRLEKLLEEGKIDLSISAFPHRRSKAIQTQKLYQEELVLIASPELLSERPKAQKLATVPIIDYFPQHRLFERWWRTHFSKKPPKTEPRVFAATAEMLVELVRHGLGIGVVPGWLYETHASSGEIIKVMPTPRVLVDYLWINFRKKADSKLTAEKAYRELLRALL